ncbi:MAG: hypothetical protein JWN55_2009 [Frankiales bacterium]|nr:hypothetical protein [Frankiales bacterium]
MPTSSGEIPDATKVVALRDAAAPFAALGHAVVALDGGGRITFWNAEASSLSGWAAETALGRPLYDLLVGRSRLELIEGLDLLATGRGWHADLDVEGPRGKALRIELSAEPVRCGEALCGSVAVLRSLSSHEIERRLHELATVLRTVPDAVVVVDNEARIREWNPAAEAMFGWSRPHMLGVEVTSIIPADEHDGFRDLWAQLVEGRELPPYETRRLGRDGGKRLVSVHTASYRERGAFAGAVATYRDLSSRQHDDRLLSDLVAEVPVVLAAYDEQARITLAAGGGYLRPGISSVFAHGAPLLTTLRDNSQVRQAVVASLSGSTTQLQVLFDDRVWQCQVAPLEAGGFLSAVDVTGERVVDDRLQALLSAAPLAFVTFDASGRVTYAAGSAFRTMGVEADDLIGLAILEVYGDNAEIADAVLRCLAGHRVDLVTSYRDHVWDLHYRSYRDSAGAITGGVVIAQDTSSWVRPADPTPLLTGPESGARRLEVDQVTGLPAQQEIQGRLSTPVPDGLTRAVAVLDLDAFELVRGAHGEAAADEVLQVVAGRLVSAESTAVVGRWAADAFVLVLDAPDARDELGRLLDALTAAVAEPVTVADLVLHLSCSVGVAVSDAVPSAELARSAEVALEQAHDDDGAQIRWFKAESRPALGGVAMLRELRGGIANDELRLHFQPIVAISTSEVVAVEALVRWQHPVQGLLPPSAFVGMAERSGVIRDLGPWVARAGCRQALALAAQGNPLRVALNVSARQLVEHGFIDVLVAALDETGCPPTSLIIEVTESALAADLDVAAASLARLKDLGVGVALDDFGTGHSSLLYLRRFPVDMLKIDRSFVAGLGTSTEDTAIVASTVSLGHRIGVKCVAEGVETREQLELLRDMGCDLAQGYLFSRALPAEQLTPWLADHADQTSMERPRRRVRPAPTPPPETDQILRMHAEGASLNTIAAVLNMAGHRTARGTRWRAQSVAAVVARWAFPTLALGDDDQSS